MKAGDEDCHVCVKAESIPSSDFFLTTLQSWCVEAKEPFDANCGGLEEIKLLRGRWPQLMPSPLFVDIVSVGRIS